MSYIRPGSSGQYVDIPNGSNYYIYGNGNDISGWSYGQFAALIGGVVDEIDWSGGDRFSTEDHIKQYFTDHFGGWESDYRGGITPPERAEIFCQCVDKRIDGIELSDSLQEAVQEWANEFDALRNCEYCGDEIRPAIYNDDTRYVCNSDECELKSEAERYDMTVAEMRKARSFEDFDDEWDYIVEHSGLDELGES